MVELIIKEFFIKGRPLRKIYVNPKQCTTFMRVNDSDPEEGFLLYMSDGRTLSITRDSFLRYQNAFVGKTTSGRPLYAL